MSHYFVVDNPKDWPLSITGVEIVSARDYLTNPRYRGLDKARVFNLCRSYSYQSIGYYVSLLAAARGHHPMPSVVAIQEMKSLTILRFVSEELDEVIQKSLQKIQADRFVLSVYFGKNVAKHYDRLSGLLFRQFQAPILRARFFRNGEKWMLQSIKTIPSEEVPEEHWPSVHQFAKDFFDKRPPQNRRKKETRYDLAILINRQDKTPPSNEKAVKKFVKAAENKGFEVELIDREDYGRLAEFDALFIRETTNVHHHTYRFAQRAEAEGLVVIDDPESILRCTNKVFLAELLEGRGIDCPKSIIVDKYTRGRVLAEMGLPCIVKQPDSSFSQGVHKATSPVELEKALDELFDDSELVIAQEFLPTEFDWRVGIIDRQVLYVCKYFMARGNWKIQHTDNTGETDYGEVEAVPIDKAPKKVLKTALAAANLIGDGLYGVDLKQMGQRVVVIEVNDNPSIDVGFEDRLLKDTLFERIIDVFVSRLEKKRNSWVDKKEFPHV